MRYIHTSPWWLRLAFPKHCIWTMPSDDKDIYLTFDDGPHPEITPWVMNQLNQYHAKATFFCVGKNVDKYPDTYRQIIAENHRVGNHTHQHMNSKNTAEAVWLQDVKEASKRIDSDLFRPPYGQISRFQEKVLRESKPGWRTIMWSVLSGDFDQHLRGEDCTRIVNRYSKSGGIIVFHDSEKAWPRLQKSLPEVLHTLSHQGYRFHSIK